MRSASTTFDFGLAVLSATILVGLVVALLPRVSVRSSLEAVVALSYGALQWVVLDQLHDGRALVKFDPHHGITTVDLAGIAPCALLIAVVVLRAMWHRRERPMTAP
jgi:hypothetical protein